MDQSLKKKVIKITKAGKSNKRKSQVSKNHKQTAKKILSQTKSEKSTMTHLVKKAIIKPKKTQNLKADSQRVVQVEDFVYKAKVGKRSEVYLVGTAHVSKKSVELVKQTLNYYQPDIVYLELDEERKKSLIRKDYREMDVLKMIKSNKMLFFIFYLIMGIIQKKIAEKYGTQPGGEFIAALEWANFNNKEVILVDRNAQVTIKRAWRSMSLFEQFRFLFSGLLATEEGEEFDVENMKEDDILTNLIKKLGLRFPGIKRIVIDERDIFMSHGIQKHLEKREMITVKSSFRKKKTRGVAVVGAGHLGGMKDFFSSLPKNSNISSYLQVPPPHRFWQVFPWTLTGIIVMVFVIGFWYSDWATIGEAFLSWTIITGGFSAVGTILAGGHPFTVVTALGTAPVTTLHPVLGVGLFAAAVQFYFSPPRVKDFETLSLKLGHFTSWWQNRVTRIFLVFFFSSLGAGIGMWIALTRVIVVFS